MKKTGVPLTATVSKQLSPRLTHPKQWAVFTQIDTDGSGQLDEDELFAYYADYADESVANALIAALDSDGDGTVDFNEFCAGWSRFFGGEVASVAEVAAAVRLQSWMRGCQVRKSLGTVKPEAAATIQAATRRWMAGMRIKRAVGIMAADQQAKQQLHDEFLERQHRHGVRTRSFKDLPSDNRFRLAETAMTSSTKLELQEWAQDQSEFAYLNCPGGHGLLRFEAARRFGCDLCGTRVKAGGHLHGCRMCDYDVCGNCFTGDAPSSSTSLLNRTLSRTLDDSSSSPRGLRRDTEYVAQTQPPESFFDAARGLPGVDGGGDAVQHAKIELWYDRAKGGYRKVPAGQREREEEEQKQQRRVMSQTA